MEANGFDALARRLAAPSRRRLLRGLAGMVAAVAGGAARPASAGIGEVPLGGSCLADIQCAQGGVPEAAPDPRDALDPARQGVICAPNGYGHDGAFNCCRLRAGSCADDADCCGAGFCFRGLCADEA